MRLPHAGHDYVGLAGLRGEIDGSRVADRDGRVLGEQQVRHRLADDLAAADDDGATALELDAVLVEQLHASRGRGRNERRVSEIELAGAHRMEAVDVLRRRDEARRSAAVELLRQGQLDEDAVHLVVSVEPLDELAQLLGRSLGRQPVVVALDARLECGPCL